MAGTSLSFPAPRACPTRIPAAWPRPRAGKKAMPLIRKAMLEAASSGVPKRPTTTRNRVQATSSPLIRRPMGMASTRKARSSGQLKRRASVSEKPPALKNRYAKITADTACAATVAMAAPLIPSCGSPHRPRISPQARNAFTVRETNVTAVTMTGRPIPESQPARAAPSTGKNEPAMQMRK